jgi:hypothetical protein
MEGLPKKEEKNLRHFDKVIGVPENQHESFKEYITKKSRVDYLKYLEQKDGSLEKTNDEKFMIDYAQNVADTYANAYGNENPYHLTEDVILVQEKTRDINNPVDGIITVNREEHKTLFVCKIFHEMIHLKSYISLQETNQQEKNHRKITPARSGFSVYSRDGKFKRLENVDEALTGYLTQLFFEQYVKENQFFINDLKLHGNPRISRKEELNDLIKIIDEILEKNPDDFKHKEEILDLFLRAKFQGNLLPVARLIEKNFGPGSVHSFAEKTKREV